MTVKISGTIVRASNSTNDCKRRMTRHYKSVANAFSRMYDFMVRNGYVGDVIEIYSTNFGYQIGTIKMTLKGRIETNIVKD
jgi:hypothetical protein